MGGVPFGCDNIGDEAFLASVIGLVRGLCPDAKLVVSTGDRAGTERKFGLKTILLYGFDPATPEECLAESPDGVVFFIWAGATGLSDYPEMAYLKKRWAERRVRAVRHRLARTPGDTAWSSCAPEIPGRAPAVRAIPEDRGFLDHVLDDGFVDYGHKFLRDRLGERQEPGAEAGRGDHGFPDGFHV